MVRVLHVAGQLLVMVPVCLAQPTVSSPQYTTMHYVLMAFTLIIVTALVIGILVLVRREMSGRPRMPRRTLIKVRPRQTEETRREEALVVEDLVDGHMTIASAPRSTTYIKTT
ncbi:hypothetical protein BaRGS_00030988 [Batillaria attramentaria]|uniref:Uncharacterized protein n=1 Tax=Batillaria attramentaria TaxID=370345 RepID=A0ABD0JT47_9CAEN